MSAQILTSMFDVISWKDENVAFIECPGKHLHGSKNGKRDCRVNIDNAPTIFCLHSSCCSIIEEANYKFRRAIYDNKPQEKREFSESDKEKIKQELAKKRKEQDLRDWAIMNKESIFKNNEWPVADVFHESPFMTDSPESDAQEFVETLYKPDDVLWNGAVIDSGSPINRFNFKTVEEWWKLGSRMKGNFTCPATFKPDSVSRSNENVVSRPYLVVESDKLSADQTCSLFKWMKDFMELKAIVWTGGKSMHGWFVFPSDELLEKLKIILPEMDCDEALFKPSQPVRLPGVTRDGRWQCLYYLNKGKL